MLPYPVCMLTHPRCMLTHPRCMLTLPRCGWAGTCTPRTACRSSARAEVRFRRHRFSLPGDLEYRGRRGAVGLGYRFTVYADPATSSRGWLGFIVSYKGQLSQSKGADRFNSIPHQVALELKPVCGENLTSRAAEQGRTASTTRPRPPPPRLS